MWSLFGLSTFKCCLKVNESENDDYNPEERENCAPSGVGIRRIAEVKFGT